MKIEKLSDNQIRCTLNKSDLASRQLKISELAYGSEKAKDLFRDMMQQASYELGFEAEDIPLMIEAIPVSTDCIVLVITKVEDPEELDTRFSKFAPTISGEEDEDSDFPYDNDPLDDLLDSQDESNNGADDVINLFSKVKDYLKKNVEEIVDRPKNEKDRLLGDNGLTNNNLSTNNLNNNNLNSNILNDKGSRLNNLIQNNSDDSNFIPFNKSLKNSTSNGENEMSKLSNLQDLNPSEVINHEKELEVSVTRIFLFHELNIINNVANIINNMYSGTNSLYKDVQNNHYYLIIDKSNCTPAAFNKVCNILSEYGNKITYSYASQAFIEEHYDTIIKGSAIQILATL